jgi:hypothetical protein
MAKKGKATGVATSSGASKLSDRDITDAYLYLLGRLLVLRQEHLDFRDEGFEWNELVHHEPGGVAWPNPNLDVAYSEAWMAVDEHSSTRIEVPEITGRYYTVQILNAWGETLVNLNERNFRHASGQFLICLRGAPVSLPVGTARVDLPGPKARVLIRVELGADREEAVRLQHLFRMEATGSPVINPPVSIPLFTNDKLPGAEAFEVAPAILAGEPDINPGTSVMQSKVRAVSGAANDTGDRKRIDEVIKRQAWASLKQQIAAMGVSRNGWVKPRIAGNYGDDWAMRTVVNYTGIWANNQQEVVYFGNGAGTTPLHGSETYTMTFPTPDQPDAHVRYFWSVTCVDAVNYRVIPNRRNRFLLSKHSPLELGQDGSLTLIVAPQPPADLPESNWLPTPAGENYVLTWRSYGPDHATAAGEWFPPALTKRG